MSLSFSAALIRELYENPEPTKLTDKKDVVQSLKNTKLEMQKEELKKDQAETFAHTTA